MLISNLYENEEHDYPGVRSKNLLVLSGTLVTGLKRDEHITQDARLSIIKKGDAYEFWVEPNPLENVFGKGKSPIAVYSEKKMLNLVVRNRNNDVVDRFKAKSLEYMRAAFFNGFKPSFKRSEYGKEIGLKHSMVNSDSTESEVCVWFDNYGDDDVTLKIEVTYSTYDPEKGYDPDNEYVTVRWDFPLSEDYYEEMRDFLGAHHGRMRRHDHEDKTSEYDYQSAVKQSAAIKSAKAYLDQHTPKKKRGW